jgi:uncharacterized protein YoxC
MPSDQLNEALRSLAPYIRKEYFILGVSALLLVWAFASGWSLIVKTRRVRQAFAFATRGLGGASDPSEFTGTYEAASSAIGKNALLGAGWRGFTNTLIIPTAPNRPIFATADAARWFDVGGLYRRAGCDLRYQAALPGLLVGAGLLFTFFGLAVGLAAAGDVVASGNAAGRNQALQDLLGAASVKFITSLVGLGLSIAYALFRKFQLRTAERAQVMFLDALHDRLPLRLPAFLQAEANALAERQYAEVQRIGTDFFVNLGATLEQKFDAGLEQHIGPLAEAIRLLSDRLARQNEGAMEEMLRSFLQQLKGETDNSMDGAAKTIATLAQQLAGLEGGMKTAAQSMSEAADKVAQNLADGTRSALGGVTDQVAALVAELRAAAREAAQNNAAAGEAQRAVGEQAARELADTMRRAADGLEATATTIAQTMGTGAADASRRLVEATEAMRNDLREVLSRFGANLDATGAALTKGAEAGGETLSRVAAGMTGELAAAAQSLRAAGEAAGAELRRGGADAQAGMSDAAGKLVQGAAGLSGNLAGLGAAATGLADGARALGQSARDAAAPLVASAAGLSEAGAAARDATRPLQAVAEVMAGALSGLRNAAEAMTASQRQSDALAQRLASAAERFDKVDEKLATTLRALKEGLDGYQQQITAFFRDMDGGLSSSLNQLNSLVQDLEGTIADYNEAPRRKVKNGD